MKLCGFNGKSLPMIAETTCADLCSNQIDLRILREMGVEADRKKYQKQLAPVQKLRAGVFAVIAAIRMSNMEEQWRGAKQIGEELKLQRAKQTKRSSWRVRDT